MDIFLPKKVKDCISTIEKAGYEAFCVGGAVRDLLMGITPFDFDVATNCPPEITVTLFERTVPTGIKHGTVTVICDEMPIEVTTYRTETGYADSRHPDSVNFVNSIKDDLSRRDFTVNAIAYNDKTGIYDPFNGYDDIKNKTLRTVGNPIKRFGEDGLRIMRLFRFASQLGFSIADSTKKGAEKQLYLLEKISVERIFNELCKLLTGKYIEKSRELFSLGGLEFLGLPACDTTMLRLLPRDRSLRFAALILLASADTNLLQTLKADNSLKYDVQTLLSLYNGDFPKTRAEIKNLLNSSDEENLKRYFLLYGLLKNTDCTKSIKTLYEILENCEPYRICDLAVNGDDIRALGINGCEVGKTLELLRKKVCEDPSLNRKDRLILLIK